MSDLPAASTPQHQTVLLTEAAEALVTQPGGTYVDGTYGRGGHSRAVLRLLNAQGRLIAFDRDPEAVAAAALGDDAPLADPRFTIVHASFAQMAEELAARGVTRVDGVLLDVGSSRVDLQACKLEYSIVSPK